MTIPITDAREELATSKNPKTNPPKKSRKPKTPTPPPSQENPCNLKITCFIHKLYLFETKKNCLIVLKPFTQT